MNRNSVNLIVSVKSVYNFSVFVRVKGLCVSYSLQRRTNFLSCARKGDVFAYILKYPTSEFVSLITECFGPGLHVILLLCVN